MIIILQKHIVKPDLRALLIINYLRKSNIVPDNVMSLIYFYMLLLIESRNSVYNTRSKRGIILKNKN